MNLTFKKISIKNFLSFGNVPEELDLTSSNYRVIIGKNKDKSDDNTEDANGVGKSSVMQAIHFALFGKAIGNKITLPSLVNNINKKNLLVKLDFSIDDVEYTIERGRSPTLLKFYKNGTEITDESLGDSRDTQTEIEKVIGITSDVFSQIICLTCGVPAFLDQPLSMQKEIIEKILGVDVISKKIVALKSLLTETKNTVNNKQFEYDTLVNQKKVIEDTIKTQLEELKRNKETYEKNKSDKIIDITNRINAINSINFEEEEKILKDISEYEIAYKENLTNKLAQEKLKLGILDTINIYNAINGKIEALKNFDFDKEREAFKYNEELKKEQSKYDTDKALYKVNIDKLNKEKQHFEDLGKKIAEKESELKSIKDGVCPVCGNVIDKEHTKEHRKKVRAEVKKLKEEYHQSDLEILELNDLVSNFKEKEFNFIPTTYRTYEDMLKDENNFEHLNVLLSEQEQKIRDTDKEIKSIVIKDLGTKPVSKYSSIEELLTQKVTLENLRKQLTELMEEKNPFDGQEESILKMKENIVEPNDNELNNVKNDLEHQEVLLKLLSSPTSFIRKNILDKSLEFLNAKIKYYLIKLGSLHSVELNNDMSITISSMGLDYNYVSTGEMSRISFALNFAFRDVWEALNNKRINLFMFDEILDKSGLDTSGKKDIVDCLSSIEDRNLLVVSHDEIIKSSTMDIITIVKEQGFSHIE